METTPAPETIELSKAVKALKGYDKLINAIEDLKDERPEMEQRALSMLIDQLAAIKQQHEAYVM